MSAVKPDVIKAVRLLLTNATSAGTGVDHELPAGFNTQAGLRPFVRVSLEDVISDVSDNRYEIARIRADCFGRTDGEARALSREVRSVVLPPEYVVGGYHGTPEGAEARILGISVYSGPYPLPDPTDLDVYRILLSVPYR